MSIFDLAAHTEVSSWKQEDNVRYFFPVPEAEELRSGGASFLFDRKGKGKTAVGQSILIQRRDGDLATSLSFKNYPFNALYSSLRDNAYKAPNQYSAGWRFVILCHVARLMADDKQLDEKRRKTLRALFSEDVREALSSRIGRWLSGGFQLDLPGLGGIGLGVEREFAGTTKSLAERADLLQRFLAPDLARTKAKYYIVFDELDEDYTSSASPDERKEYLSLLTSLLKAVRQLREDPDCEGNIYPIVLLRDDIFRLLQDNDRAKWIDNTVHLDWSEQRLKELLAFRLCRAIGLKETLPFDEVWRELVGPRPTFVIKGIIWDKFEFIASYTLRCPRDFIYYLSYASRRVCEKLKERPQGGALSIEVLKGCAGPFADHLRLELEDEIAGQLPNIHEVMNILLNLKGQLIKREDFRQAYENARLKAGGSWPQPYETVLDTLYSFSVIGFVRAGRHYYRYLDPGVDLDPKATIVLHKGLNAARNAMS